MWDCTNPKASFKHLRELGFKLALRLVQYYFILLCYLGFQYQTVATQTVPHVQYVFKVNFVVYLYYIRFIWMPKANLITSHEDPSVSLALIA